MSTGDPLLYMMAALTPSGDYIGSEKDAHFLCDKMGIAPELRTPKSQVCSVGWSEKHKAWFGWSHRAIMRFKTRDEAAAFAESVS